jgi:hypothetical protein
MSARLLAACLVVGLWLSGCSHSSLPVSPSDDYVPQTDLTNTLHNLRMAFRDLNADRYGELLDEDFHHFHNRRDYGPDLPWSDDCWGKEEELDLIRCLFGGEPDIHGVIISECRLDFESGVPQQSPVDPGWVQVVLEPVDLTTDTVCEYSGDEWLLKYPLRPWILHLVQTEQRDPHTGERIWKIIRREEIITDETISWEEFWEQVCRS